MNRVQVSRRHVLYGGHVFLIVFIFFPLFTYSYGLFLHSLRLNLEMCPWEVWGTFHSESQRLMYPFLT